MRRNSLTVFHAGYSTALTGLLPLASVGRQSPVTLEEKHLVEPPASPAVIGSNEGASEPRQLLLIDDDELSREVLGLIAVEAKFEAISFESGEAALAHLSSATPPFAILSDMQMPGISGDDLGRRLRTACGPKTLLLAMSGSQVPGDEVTAFDGFLLKPFSAHDLQTACEHRTAAAVAELPTKNGAILDRTVYEKFSGSLPPTQLAGLYAMCLSDARKRIETMRRALADGDDDLYRRSAHAIKGGCGMVGALELTKLAAVMEREGLPPVVEGVTDEGPLTQFMAASFRLERMLEGT